MRIVIVSDAWTPQINGVVRTYEGLLGPLRAAGHVVRVIGPGDFPRRRPLPGYSEIELVLRPAKPLRQMIDDFAPEAVHIATEGPLGWAARRLCLRRGWPFTTAYHSHFPDYAALRAAKFYPLLSRPVKAFFIAMLRRFHAPAGAVLTTTASVEATLRQWGIKAPLRRLTRGVDTAVFYPGAGPFFHALPRPRALYVGRVALEKNIEAFLNMPWTGSKIVVGDGPARPDLQLRYPDAVFAGLQKGEALADYYRSADVFVFPSQTDTFGLVLIEAMACGLPLAGFPVAGPIDIIVETMLGATGADLGLAAMTAWRSAGTPEERFQYLKENYSWEKAAAQFIDSQIQIKWKQTVSFI